MKTREHGDTWAKAQNPPEPCKGGFKMQLIALSKKKHVTPVSTIQGPEKRKLLFMREKGRI